MTLASLPILATIIALIHLAGFASAAHAVMHSKTSQGAIAWVVSLITFPYLTLPLYWVLGGNRFHGYVEQRRSTKIPPNVLETVRRHNLPAFFSELGEGRAGLQLVCEKLGDFPFTRNNELRLLIDGQQTFDAIFAAIDQAQHYILLEYFIVRDDELGRQLKARLIAKAKQGVQVCFLYDMMGSHSLNPSYAAELAQAGVKIYPFRSTVKGITRMQLNFRNHRKITVIDGETCFVGGHNIGDEYMGRSPKMGPWRDTHVQITGPAVLGVQLPFLEDYYWASREVPELEWRPHQKGRGHADVMPLPTGPVSEAETCTLFFLEAINSAKKRIWLTSPYFVPDDALVNAFLLAALRGVDVRILLPSKPDHLLVYLASFAYLEPMLGAGIKMYRYQPGFLHQKVMLIDEDLASIGTANLDNRSMRLNFEISILVSDTEFAKEVEEMLSRDLANSRLMAVDEIQKRNLAFKAVVQAARLLSPIL